MLQEVIEIESNRNENERKCVDGLVRIEKELKKWGLKHSLRTLGMVQWIRMFPTN